MARSPRFARPCASLMIVFLMPLVLFTGCRSNSRRDDDGGGGGGGCGCCRGASPKTPPAAAAPISSPVVDFTPASPADHNESVAANTSSASSLPTQSPYGGQTICPVTGAPLGSMGTPIPVTVKGQTIYVCCQGCVAKVQRDPDTYLRKVQAERDGKSQGTSSQSNSSSRSDSGGSCCRSGGGGCCGH